jgi:hypothetical protein
MRSSGGSLADKEVTGLVDFANQAERAFALLGEHRHLDDVRLIGPADEPTLAVVFHDDLQCPDRRYSYEWAIRRRDVEDGPFPFDQAHLAFDAVLYLGNWLTEDLETSPGLPRWAPSDDGLIHIDVMSDAYRGRAAQRSEGG